MDKFSLPIGVFDSGVGGLTVAREIFRNLPNEKIIYFGDTARVPYGNKSKETVIRYSKQIAAFLVKKNVKAIVIACNTASAFALDALKDYVDVPVIGVVEPGARAAAKATRNNRVGVIGTVGTIKSGLYDKTIKAIKSDAAVFGRACPLFVNLVEEGMIDDPVTVEMIHRYLDPMVCEADIDTLILGCTHYPLLRKVIGREISGSSASGSSASGSPASGSAGNICLVNPAYETAISLKELLKKNGLENPGNIDFSDHVFYVSDDVEKFRQFANDILGLEIAAASLETLE